MVKQSKNYKRNKKGRKRTKRHEGEEQQSEACSQSFAASNWIFNFANTRNANLAKDKRYKSHKK